jgi:hypothetical protein
MEEPIRMGLYVYIRDGAVIWQTMWIYTTTKHVSHAENEAFMLINKIEKESKIKTEQKNGER